MTETTAGLYRKLVETSRKDKKLEFWWPLWKRALEIRDANGGVWPGANHPEIGSFIRLLRVGLLEGRFYTTEQWVVIRREKFPFRLPRGTGNAGCGPKLDQLVAKARTEGLTQKELNTLRSRLNNGCLSETAQQRLREAGVNL